MSPIIIPPILFLVGLFLVFSTNVPLNFSRVLRRPNTFYAGAGVIMLATVLWFVLGYIESSKNGQLMWAMPIGCFLAILLMMFLSVKDTESVKLFHDKNEFFSKSVLLVFVFIPLLIGAVVLSLMTSPVVAVIVMILGIFGIGKFMKKNKN